MAIPAIRPLAITGFTIIALFFGTFGVWAVFSKLDGASIAPGIVTINSQRKTVQHLEGGIIARLTVAEGDTVEKGQTLIMLDDTQARSQLELLVNNKRNAQAREARLIAERDNVKGIVFPQSLLDDEDDPRVEELLTNQHRIFVARRGFFESQKEIINKQLAQNEAELDGQSKRLTIERRRLSIIGEEIAGNRKLAEKGYVSKTQVLRLEREETQILSTISQIQSNATRLAQNVAESQAQLKEQELERIKEIVEGLRESRQESYELDQQIAAATDVLNRTKILAPLNGTVLNLQVFSEEGVISPGQELLDIVPNNERMVIEARVDPSDIDQVSAGMKAQIRLTALSMRSVKPLNGELLTVSADRLVDEQSGLAYYLARVELVDDVQEMLNGIALYPGMQAEVMLLTEPRTPFNYLMKPLTESFNRAFREE
ncbi:membrane-fusion protein [Enterovibrio norvegicus]|uniref:Membrane fusion protein (MFP) family protein n=2 Tax=Enterovibrio norvegicus TaxID=188144 RepID=A0A1I5R249_9GAMM|nr:HlyD family type I secretion periplasmic adaptor subunit [Enterovibrio norvegicus]MCC4799497.1 HlyD family type I secretion periplasmic adaptor subunit [Enterovibrio norvegicus]OEF52713.1 membrane-fusion protein [Enterovibrio norvegicus]OEF57714.1 membrane-fusion protein [Enterovibrio norvegicus]PMH64840.1 membrane-fusion protein [Enterovibrio norvegicus]PMI31569.1 membrane-fusion protein [Enterovibrio norvegicus]